MELKQIKLRGNILFYIYFCFFSCTQGKKNEVHEKKAMFRVVGAIINLNQYSNQEGYYSEVAVLIKFNHSIKGKTILMNYSDDSSHYDYTYIRHNNRIYYLQYKIAHYINNIDTNRAYIYDFDCRQVVKDISYSNLSNEDTLRKYDKTITDIIQNGEYFHKTDTNILKKLPFFYKSFDMEKDTLFGVVSDNLKLNYNTNFDFRHLEKYHY